MGLAFCVVGIGVGCASGPESVADGGGSGTGSGGSSGGGSGGSGGGSSGAGDGGVTGSADASPGSGNPDATTSADGSSSTDGRPTSDTAATNDAVSPADAGGRMDSGLGEGGGTTDATAPTDSALGDGGADPCGPSNPGVVPLPTIGTSTFNVTTYGAAGDGKTDDTSALQAALTAAGAAGGGVVSVPAGTYLSGPISMSSGTRLDLASGAVLEMLPMASWPGTTPFIAADNAHDIALTGAGTIEGQGQAWWNALTATPSLTRPQEVSLSNSTRVLIRGIRLQNPPEEHIWVKGDTDVTITGITIETLAVSGQHAPNNTDGIDVSAKGVFFCGNSVACGDDNIAMSGSNIYVGYSTFGVGHGCSIGSITQNGVSSLTVEHMTFNGTTSGIRMKSARGRGGLVTGLSYSNITMTNVENPVYITSYYPTLPTDPTTDTAQAVTATTPQWQNITIKNLTVTGSSVAGILWGLPEAPISTLVFDNVNIQASKGMDIFHATGVSFVNGSTVTVTTAPAVIVSDATVTGIATHTYP